MSSMQATGPNRFLAANVVPAGDSDARARSRRTRAAGVLAAALGICIQQSLSAPPDIADVELRAKSYPGIQVSLPTGRSSGETDRYARGDVEIVDPGRRPGAMRFLWELGEAPPGDLLDEGMSLFDMEVEQRWSATVHALASESYYCKRGSSRVLITMWCGGNRTFSLATRMQGSMAEHRQLHERILGTFSFQNDESAQMPTPAFDAPPGYVQGTGADSGQYTSQDGSACFVFRRLADSELDEVTVRRFFEMVFEMVMESEGAEVTLASAPEHVVAADGSRRPVWSLTLRAADGATARGFLMLWPCERSGAFLGMFLASDEAREADGKAALLSARCP